LKGSKEQTFQPFPLIFFLAVAYCAGVVIAYFDRLPVTFLISLIFLTLLVRFIYFLAKTGFARFEARTDILLSVWVFALLGMLLTTIKVDLLDRSLLLRAATDRGIIDVYGTVIGELNLRGTYQNFTMRVEKIEISGKSYPVTESVRITLEREKDERPISLSGGEKVEISDVMPVVPSDERFRRYLYNQEILTLITAGPSQVRIVEPAPFIPRTLASIRKEVRKRAFRFLDQEEAALLLGILLGEQKSIPSLIQTDFSRAGVSHILAVSGEHVAMLALICVWVAKLLKLKTRNRYLLTTGCVVFFVLITGSKPSALRASLAIGIGIIGWLIGKEKHLVASLSAAALILLIYNAFFLFDIAFQLSFGASLAIAVLAPILELQFSHFPVSSFYSFKLLLVTAAVQIGLAPIVMYHFGELSVISVIANVFIVPLVMPILSLGLAANILGSISYLLGYPLFAIVSLLLSSEIKLAAFFANSSFSSLPVNLSLGALLIYYFVLFVLIVFMRKREAVLKTSTLLFASLVIPVGLLWWQVLVCAPPRQFTCTFLDVGQGDSAVIRTPSGACVLIDGGQDPMIAKNLLSSEGVSKIDLLILSHPHADHLNGLVEVVERYRIGLVLDGGLKTDSLQYREFRAAISERQIPHLVAKEKMRLKVGSDLELIVFSDKAAGSVESDLNNESLAAKVKYRDLSLLFPGDSESEEEQELCDWRGELGSSILKVPHHGSSNAADPRFLKYVRPQVAVISVGKDNKFGHPSPATAKMLESLGTKIYRTDKDGSVTITSDGRGFAVSTSR